MGTGLHISADQIAEALADDETGVVMGDVLASLMREFRGSEADFATWMQAAADHAISSAAGDDWSDGFLFKMEAAAVAHMT